MKKSHAVMYLAYAVVIGGLLAVTSIAYAERAAKDPVKYPADYREWTHIKSMVIEQGHPLYDSFGGIHHVYANEKALMALKAGESFPDGAVLIFDLLEAVSENNAVVEGNRKVLAVMQKDSGKFPDTGGWGFEGFKGDSRERIVTAPGTACFACHESRQDSDYVFSKYRR